MAGITKGNVIEMLKQHDVVILCTDPIDAVIAAAEIKLQLTAERWHLATTEVIRITNRKRSSAMSQLEIDAVNRQLTAQREYADMRQTVQVLRLLASGTEVTEGHVVPTPASGTEVDR